MGWIEWRQGVKIAIKGRLCAINNVVSKSLQN
jgi:hypothetical protein